MTQIPALQVAVIGAEDERQQEDVQRRGLPSSDQKGENQGPSETRSVFFFYKATMIKNLMSAILL